MDLLKIRVSLAKALLGILLGALTAFGAPQMVFAQTYGAPTYVVPSYGVTDWLREVFGGGEPTYTQLDLDDGFTEAYSGCASGDCGPGYAARRPALPRRQARAAQARALRVPPPVVRRRAVEMVSVPAAKTGSWLPHAAAIQRAIDNGHGRSAGRYMCARGVWRILHAAGLVKGGYRTAGADAKYMGPILRRNGFVMDMNVCSRPGAVRIYDGNRSGHRFMSRSKGDKVGHIEIVGTDGMFHHYLDSYESIDVSMKRRFGYASRRPLMQCWYKP